MRKNFHAKEERLQVTRSEEERRSDYTVLLYRHIVLKKMKDVFYFIVEKQAAKPIGFGPELSMLVCLTIIKVTRFNSIHSIILTVQE